MGAVLVFSFVGLAWANSSADVARYQRPGSSGAASMLWATFGAGLPSFVLICYGALLAASNATLAHNIAANPLDSLWAPAFGVVSGAPARRDRSQSGFRHCARDVSAGDLRCRRRDFACGGRC